jgi:hypothetical protein
VAEEVEMVAAVVVLAAVSVSLVRLVPPLERSQSTNYARRSDTVLCCWKRFDRNFTGKEKMVIIVEGQGYKYRYGMVL